MHCHLTPEHLYTLPLLGPSPKNFIQFQEMESESPDPQKSLSQWWKQFKSKDSNTSNPPPGNFTRPVLMYKSKSSNSALRPISTIALDSDLQIQRDKYFNEVAAAYSDSHIFATELDESVRFASANIISTNKDGVDYRYGKIPIVVAKCGVFLKSNGLNIEGIFRVGGSAKRIKELQYIFSSAPTYGKNLDWDGFTVHDAASLLRRFLNALPEPIIPLDKYEQFREPLRSRPSIIKYMKKRASQRINSSVPQNQGASLQQTRNNGKEKLKMPQTTEDNIASPTQNAPSLHQYLEEKDGVSENRPEFEIESESKNIPSQQKKATKQEFQSAEEPTSNVSANIDESEINTISKKGIQVVGHMAKDKSELKEASEADDGDIDSEPDSESKIRKSHKHSQSQSSNHTQDNNKDERRSRREKKERHLAHEIKKSLKEYELLIISLPHRNRQLLMYILDMLSIFAAHSDVNRMPTWNLAGIFQPSILSHPSHDMVIEEYDLSRSVLTFLVEYCHRLSPKIEEYVFKGIEKKNKNKQEQEQRQQQEQEHHHLDNPQNESQQKQNEPLQASEIATSTLETPNPNSLVASPTVKTPPPRPDLSHQNSTSIARHKIRLSLDRGSPHSSQQPIYPISSPPTVVPTVHRHRSLISRPHRRHSKSLSSAKPPDLPDSLTMNVSKGGITDKVSLFRHRQSNIPRSANDKAKLSNTIEDASESEYEHFDKNRSLMTVTNNSGATNGKFYKNPSSSTGSISDDGKRNTPNYTQRQYYSQLSPISPSSPLDSNLTRPVRPFCNDRNISNSSISTVLSDEELTSPGSDSRLSRWRRSLLHLNSSNENTTTTAITTSTAATSATPVAPSNTIAITTFSNPNHHDGHVFSMVDAALGSDSDPKLPVTVTRHATVTSIMTAKPKLKHSNTISLSIDKNQQYDSHASLSGSSPMSPTNYEQSLTSAGDSKFDKDKTKEKEKLKDKESGNWFRRLRSRSRSKEKL